jgi:hypothetical protein
MREPSSKEKIRRFLRANVGRVITSKEIRDAVGPGASEWARRVRELRDDERWPIITHNDSKKLKPGQYMLTRTPPEKSGIAVTRTISAKLRAEVFDRNGFTCQMCGLTPGEIDPYTKRPVRLHVGHIKDKSLGGKDELSNLRTLCSSCNQGAKNVTAEKPTAIWLLSRVRRAGIDEQKAVMEWLRTKFEE